MHRAVEVAAISLSRCQGMDRWAGRGGSGLAHAVGLRRDANEPRNPFLIRGFFLRCARSGSGPLAAVVFGKAIDKGQGGSGIVGQFLLSGGIGRLRLWSVAVAGKCVLELSLIHI